METHTSSELVQGKGIGVYIFDEIGRVLLAQRGPKARHEQYRWEAPGGAVEPDETFEAAAVREVREELGVTVTLTGRLAELQEVVDSNGATWDAVLFSGSITDRPVIQEPEKCVGYGWFTKEEAVRLSLADYVVQDFKTLGWL